ncbi:MAG: tRNA 2-thiocytidine biosynthesis TtcA family protein [Oscillospiraceae bacterium]|jgi:tRNA 2-thiocytidine biosynthesis protein TtcA|nr:tRNA 2-thiocytidine biosynthesis TtcA family protein [Oscillospiraceae bacterium]
MGDALDKLLSPMRAAVERYQMIKPGDNIAVGLSGGKDSIILLALLKRLQRFYPSPFKLFAITLDPGFNGKNTDYTQITLLCENLDIPHIIKRTQLSEIIFDLRKESNPCSLCSRMRRGVLHKAAQEAGCNVVALGHHLDDAAQTLLMNMFASGTISCFSPVSVLTRRELRLIRPLIYLRQSSISSAVKKCGLPVVKSKCPVDGKTHRKQIENLILSLSPQYGNLSERLVGAMQKGHISGW